MSYVYTYLYTENIKYDRNIISFFKVLLLAFPFNRSSVQNHQILASRVIKRASLDAAALQRHKIKVYAPA